MPAFVSQSSLARSLLLQALACRGLRANDNTTTMSKILTRCCSIVHGQTNADDGQRFLHVAASNAEGRQLMEEIIGRLHGLGHCIGRMLHDSTGGVQLSTEQVGRICSNLHIRKDNTSADNATFRSALPLDSLWHLLQRHIKKLTELYVGLYACSTRHILCSPGDRYTAEERPHAAGAARLLPLLSSSRKLTPMQSSAAQYLAAP